MYPCLGDADDIKIKKFIENRSIYVLAGKCAFQSAIELCSRWFEVTELTTAVLFMPCGVIELTV